MLTLNSGMPETGSVASVVTRLALPSPAQWNGMNTVSGRALDVTCATATAVPRAERTSASSPSATPIRSASSGCISMYGSGCAAANAGTRRVCAPDW